MKSPKKLNNNDLNFEWYNVEIFNWWNLSNLFGNCLVFSEFNLSFGNKELVSSKSFDQDTLFSTFFWMFLNFNDIISIKNTKNQGQSSNLKVNFESYSTTYSTKCLFKAAVIAISNESYTSAWASSKWKFVEISCQSVFVRSLHS